jgi:hypothetical protein
MSGLPYVVGRIDAIQCGLQTDGRTYLWQNGMNSYLIASIAFICVFAGSLVGLCLNAWLPAAHRSPASHDAIKLGTGMISVLASLVLGLLTASVKSSFDTTDGQIRTFAANLILLNQTLRDYGPETARSQSLLRDYTARAIEDQWPQESDHIVQMEDTASGQILDDTRLSIAGLPASDAFHQELRGSALRLIDTALRTRWLMIERAESSIQPVYLIILISWIALIFVSFGYNAPLNATVIFSFFICALALASCLFIITDLDTPFSGLIALSSHAMRDALAHMSR